MTKEEAINKAIGFLPSNLDDAAGVIVARLVPTLGQKNNDGSYVKGTFDYFSREELIGLVKAGAEWMAGQFQKIEGELVDWYETNGVEYCHGISTNESFEVPEGFYIRKK